jgi:pyruvate,water dikinase
MNAMILPLDGPLDAQHYGGKAARLSICLRAGLPVPPGIALHPDLVARLAHGHQTAGERTRLAQHLARFGTAALAVRSSSVGEDGTTASFAGQHETRLNVRGLEAVCAALAAVWASGQTESARRYRTRMGITGETQVAVLIQELVPAEVAGVLFTCDPLSGVHDRWMVEASWGLGEAVVEGLVTPDHYIIAPTGELLGCQLGDKERMIALDEQGGTHEMLVTDAGRVQQACLDGEALSRLVALGAACERLFGPGQDIEWAWCGGKLFLLQCRPVTRGGNTRWTCLNLGA